MNWGAYISIVTLSCIKFMFSPALGPALDLHWLETYISAIFGAIVTMLVIYYLSEQLQKRNHNKVVAKRKKLIAEGRSNELPKIFTRKNKIIVKLKRKIPIIPFCLWAPFVLSIPVGTIICTKFYGKNKLTLPTMVIGVLINGLISTLLVYFIAK